MCVYCNWYKLAWSGIPKGSWHSPSWKLGVKFRFKIKGIFFRVVFLNKQSRRKPYVQTAEPLPPASRSGTGPGGSVRPAVGLRGLRLACGCAAVEIAVGLPLGQPSVENVLDVLHDEVDGH